MPLRPAQPLNKEETTILKGVAILSMIFMHLFNNVGRMEAHGVQDIILGGSPLSHHISLLCLCVPMYLFLSGYGLYISWQKNNRMHPLRRVLLLYLNFWIIFAVFIGLACWLKPSAYPGSLSTFISNFTVWDPTYNGEWWFLFPYIILVFLSPLLFPLIAKYNSLLVFLASGFLYLCVYGTIKFNQDYLIHHRLLYNPILVFSCSFSFITGSLCAKNNIFGRITKLLHQLPQPAHIPVQLSLILLLCLLFVVQATLPVSIFGPLFGLIFMFAFINLCRPACFDRFLTLMGKQSTNMWLIHTFFCCYLFQSFIYSFTYPPLIFLITLALSYVSGLFIDFIYKPLRTNILNRFP